jgi:hypothetical protein
MNNDKHSFNDIDFKEKWETGLATFMYLFEMSSNDIIKTLKLNVNNKIGKEVLNTSPNVKKIIHNDDPFEIIIDSWDTLKVNPFGISVHWNNKYSENLTDFDKYFKLVKFSE